MTRALLLAFLSLLSGAAFLGCGGGGQETPGARETDPARVPSSTPIQNPTLYKIQGNEVLISGGASGEITPVAPTTPVSADYVIKSGDLCSTIASNAGISVEALQQANRSMDCNNLRVGDHLKIPSAAAATPTRATLSSNPTTKPGATGTSKNYTVKPGDTCAGIAQSQGVSLDAFLAANSSINSDCSNLTAGATVKIP